MKKIILKIVLYATGSLTILLVMAVLLVVLLVYGRFNDQIVRVINNQSEKLMNGRLTVGSLEGRLFKGFTLKQILITHETDTILYAGTWQIQYNLKSLLQKKIHIRTISVDDMMIRMKQDSDSVWNVLKLIPDQENEPEDPTPSTFPWEIALDDIKLRNMELNVQTLDTTSLIPDRIHATVHLRFAMKKSEMKVTIFDSKINTTKPGLQANHLSLKLNIDGDSLTVSQFKLMLPQTQMTAQASLDLSAPENLSARIDIPYLSFEDLREFLGDIPLYGKPSVEFTSENRNYTIAISNMKQEIIINAWFSGIDSLAQYNASARLKNLNLAEWTRDPGLKSNFTGTIEISGTGLYIVDNQMNTTVSFPVLEFAGYSAALRMSARKIGSKIDGRLNADSKAAKVNSEFSLNNIFKLPVYQLNANISGLNMAELSGDTLLTSDLKFNIEAEGKGINPDEIQIAAKIHSGFGTIAGFELDTLTITGEYRPGQYSLNEFRIITSPFILEAFGEGEINGRHHLGYQLILKDISKLGHFLNADSLSAAGYASGTFSGTLQDAEVLQTIILSGVQYNGLKLDSIQITLDASVHDSVTTGTMEAGLRRIQTPGMELERLSLKSAYDGSQLDNELQVIIDKESRAEALVTISTGDTLLVNIPHITLNYYDLSWEGKVEAISIDPGRNQYAATGISFESGDQTIEAEGYFSPSDPIHAHLAISNLDLDRLPLELFTPYKPEGKTDFSASLSGTAETPVLKADLEITGFKLDSLALDTIRTTVLYDDNAFQFKGSADGYGTSLLQFGGVFPFHLSLNDSMYVLPADDRFRLEVASELKSLQPFNGFFPEGISLDGSSDIRISMLNSMKDPEMIGSIRFQNGLFRYPAYGIDMRNLQLSGNLGKMRLQLDSLRMESGRGFMKADGFVEIKEMDKLSVQSFRLNMQSNRFTVTNGPQGEIVVNSVLMVQGNSESADFNGRMTIEQGVIHIDAIMSQFGMVADDPNPPLLLQAIDQSHKQMYSDSILVLEPSEFEILTLKNLKGEIDIDIPGNLWIRGKDMNFELGGNLRAIREGGQLDLFGLLDIRRGHYTVYGKRLVVNTGKIELTGGREVNPLLDVEIGYAFRDNEKQLRNLTIGVTGRALQPNIEFHIDGEKIEEKDGISYLIFGKSMAELTHGEQSSVDYNLADIGKSLALGQLSGLVQGALQSSLGLDVVDIEGSDGWSQGSVTIGKYIARNLFLSYSREFSMDRKSKISHPDNISLEYQIFKWLYLQAVSQGSNSGFDLILQKKWK